jgi:hypothetical protein
MIEPKIDHKSSRAHFSFDPIAINTHFFLYGSTHPSTILIQVSLTPEFVWILFTNSLSI